MPATLALLYPSLLLTLVGQQSYQGYQNYQNYVNSRNYQNLQNYILYPDENGIPYLVDLNQPPADDVEITYLMKDVSTIYFTLYTRDNSTEGEAITDSVDSISNSNWNPRRPTRFVTHGWQSSSSSASCTTIRDAYLEYGEYNVIVMDWGKIANNYNYGTVADSVPLVAERLTALIDFLVTNAGLDLSTTKLVGHSLGAHIVGIAARNAVGTVAEVVGLDPAHPRFAEVGPGQRIDATDAKHVQIIHTSDLGIQKAIGTSDFYPNGGYDQPGCIFDFLSSCSHSRSYYYFAESITNSKGFRATSLKKYFLSRNYDANVYMGGPTLDHNAKGRYTLRTASQPPYALG